MSQYNAVAFKNRELERLARKKENKKKWKKKTPCSAHLFY